MPTQHRRPYRQPILLAVARFVRAFVLVWRLVLSFPLVGLWPTIDSMTDNDNTSDNHLYNTEQHRRGMATRARTREDTSGNIGSLGLGGGSLSAVIPGSNEAPRPLARSLDPPKPHNTVGS